MVYFWVAAVMNRDFWKTVSLIQIFGNQNYSLAMKQKWNTVLRPNLSAKDLWASLDHTNKVTKVYQVFKSLPSMNGQKYNV